MCVAVACGLGGVGADLLLPANDKARSEGEKGAEGVKIRWERGREEDRENLPYPVLLAKVVRGERPRLPLPRFLIHADVLRLALGHHRLEHLLQLFSCL